MIKAIFFDIDGTLVSFNTHQVSDSTRLALAELRKRGIMIFISSGRHKASINNLPGLSFDGYVTVNGTLATIGNDVIYRHPIPKEDIESWLKYIDAEPHSTIFVSERGLTINFIDEHMSAIFKLLNFPSPATGDLHPIVNEPVYQIISTFTDEEEPIVMTHLPHCKTTRWHPLFTDIVEKSGGKHLGIEAIIKHLGLKQDEVMAFGDGGNDIEMLQCVGTGVVMGNATDDVKVHADYVTDSVDNDGIYNALKHFGLI